MKPLFIAAIAMASSQAISATYECAGVNRAARSQKIQIELEPESHTLMLTNQDGDVIDLERQMRRDEDRYAYAVYADYSFDGYGGFIKVSIPKKVAEGSAEPQSFTGYYVVHTYSEAGHVGTIDVRARCRRRE